MLFPDDLFCTAAASSSPTKGDPFERLAAPFVDRSERFSDQTQVHYTKQFAPIYASRLEQMRDLLTQKCIQKWGKSNIPELR